ncbi:MAG: hypothetical protein ACTSW1_05195 [Candidatus Hodarchaeales archaeon]
MAFEDFEIDLYIIYDLIIRGAGLICSHCGKKFSLEDLYEEKIVQGDEGYLGHVDCLLKYVMKAEPVISTGLAFGLVSESEVRHELLEKPYESVILDISRACSFKKLSPSRQSHECSKFIASESNLIESRSNFNYELLLVYLDEVNLDLSYSELN